MNIYIVEGFLEGPLHSRTLRATLQRESHTIVASQNEADCIIAHSAAWVFLSDIEDSQYLILLDPAYKNGSSFVIRTFRRIVHDLHHPRSSMIIERAYNFWYLISRFGRWIKLAHLIHSRSISMFIKRPKTIVISIKDSAWQDNEVLNSASRIHIEKGDHDIFWTRPEIVLTYLYTIHT